MKFEVKSLGRYSFIEANSNISENYFERKNKANETNNQSKGENKKNIEQKILDLVI